ANGRRFLLRRRAGREQRKQRGENQSWGNHLRHCPTDALVCAPPEGQMTISTRLTELLGIQHPILLAPMDVVADGRLAAAVSQAGAFGVIGGGYGNEAWLTREMDVA